MELLHKIELYFSIDAKGRNYVAGKAGSGMSTYLRGIAAKLNYLYLSRDEGPWFVKCREKIGLTNLIELEWPFNGTMTCQEFLNAFPEYKGYVIDSSTPWKVFKDWQNFNWPVPIWYAVQLRADGNLGLVNYEKNDIRNFPVGEVLINV